MCIKGVIPGSTTSATTFFTINNEKYFPIMDTQVISFRGGVPFGGGDISSQNGTYLYYPKDTSNYTSNIFVCYMTK